MAPRHDPLAVRAVRQAADCARVTLESLQLLPILSIPNLYLTAAPVRMRGGDLLAVGAKCHATRLAHQPLHRQELLFGGDVPDFHLAAANRPACRGDALPVRAERDAQDRLGMVTQGVDEFATPGVPYPHRPVPASRCDECAIRAAGDTAHRALVSLKRMNFPIAQRLQDFHKGIRASNHDPLAVQRQADGMRSGGLFRNKGAGQRSQLGLAGVPVAVDTDNSLAVGGKGNRDDRGICGFVKHVQVANQRAGETAAKTPTPTAEGESEIAAVRADDSLVDGTFLLTNLGSGPQRQIRSPDLAVYVAGDEFSAVGTDSDTEDSPIVIRQARAQLPIR